MPIEDQPQENDAMQQTNQGNAKGWQTRVEGGTAYVAETIYISSGNAGASQSTRTIDFQPYLRSLIADEKYQQKWGFYTPTDAIGKLQEQKQPSTGLDIGLMVQLMQPKQLEDVRSSEPQNQEKTERLLVLEGIRKYAAEHVLLMGRPGSGKSTALLRLLVDEARTALADPSVNIPVLVELRYLDAERPSVLERIGAFLQSHGLSVEEATLKAALAEGKLLLLIDGVNELPSEAARRAVARFRQDYPKTPMIFTTRDVAIGGDVGIEKKLEMQPLSEPQMRQFVQSYLPEQGEPMLRQLQGRLRELGQTPLLLWMLCEVFKGLKRLPSSLGLLFRWFVREYDKLKQDVPVSEGLRHWQSELLQHLAFTMMRGKPEAEPPHPLSPPPALVAIPQQEAETILAEFLRGKVDYPTHRAKEWLEDLLEYHLIQRTSQNQLEFHHQLLQEYYAAEVLLQRLPHLSDEQLKRDYLNYLKWTEPIALMLALVSDKAQALRVVKLAMNDVDLMLGARLAGEVIPDFQSQTVELVLKLSLPNRLWVNLLSATQSDVAAPGLLKTLEDEESSVRLRAVNALKKLNSEVAIPGLLKALEDKRSYVHLTAVSALRELNSEAAITVLLKTLDDEELYMRLRAVDALENLKNEMTIPGFTKALEDADLSVRRRAVDALGNLKSRAAAKGLLKALCDEHWSVRESAVKALGKLKSETVLPNLLKVLKDRHWSVRKCAVDALGELKSEAAIPELLKALEDEEPPVRWSTVIALGKIESEAAVFGLLKALEDENFYVHRSAVYVLKEIWKSEQAKMLVWRSFHSESESIAHSSDASKYLEASKLMTDSTIELTEIEPTEDKRSIPELLKDLENEDWIARTRAAKALGEQNGDEVIPALLKALENKDSDVRRSAAAALGEQNGDEVIPALLKALEDKDSGVRGSAAAALGEQNGDEVISALLKALEDTSEYVRWMVERALVKQERPEVLSFLWKSYKQQPKDAFAEAIQIIQNRCKFYNHQIAHRSTSDFSSQSHPTD